MRIAILASAVLAIGLAAASDVTQIDAQLLASAYAARYLPACIAQQPKLQGDHWEAAVVSGRPPTPSGTIRIDQATGSVSYDGPLGSKPTASAAALRHYIEYGHD